MTDTTITPLTLDDVRRSTTAALSRREVAQVLGVDPRTVTAGIADGTIPSLKLGRRVLIPRERFLALIEGAEAAR
ncbi:MULTISPECIES: helix-turn-helix domain-containing protein [unclassified Pseudoclavibacter]|uniref:helix-turn-helix domain-containing protein n=1 Tax=unclassified Pseudoclavibacter TaxID=2615177 RepID=UPI0021574215|nr:MULTISPECIES: helix-turn-helix domain-containing protein [unclassified Pseudoclavibacter]